jgi:hypothetical protein
MNLHDRLSANGVSPERLAALGLAPTTRKTAAEIAAMAPDAATAARAVQAWRAYRDEPDGFRRMRLRVHSNEAIELGRQIDQELPENESK